MGREPLGLGRGVGPCRGEQVTEQTCAHAACTTTRFATTARRRKRNGPAELRMALRSNKGPTEVVRDLQTMLLTKPPGRQTEVMSQWEYDMRHPPQNKPRSKRGQRGRRWQ